MELQGERLIPASVDATWAALNDPQVLKACIAGCESLERTGDDAFTALVAVKVGPVSARFKGNLKMTNVQAPHRYTINFDGQGGIAGFGKGSADVALTPEGGNAQTRLAYVARAQVGGKLAQVGSRLIDAAAAKIADDFFKAFEARLQALAAPAPAPAVATAGPVPTAVSDLVSARPARPPEPAGTLGWALAAIVVLVTLYFVLR